MLPRSDIPRIPARERTILSPATGLGPGSGCNCGSDLARQGNPASSPGGSVLGAPWDSTLGLALGSAAAVGRALRSAAPGAWENVPSWARPLEEAGVGWGALGGALLVFFCFSVNVSTNHTLVCAGREVAGFETPLLGNLK